MKRTYQPSNRKRKKAVGFRAKRKTKGGRKVLKRRRAKGRKKINKRLMKKKIVSLSKNEDFKSILGGKKISNKYLTIFFKKLSDKNTSSLNISFVAKKKLGNAVTRNRIKRRLRNIMNDALKTININLNYCYLLIARISVNNDPYEKIKMVTLEDFKKIK